MATHSVPHVHNEAGVATIRVGAPRFMCMGAKPPFDHPHIFIEFGDETDAVCAYCSTRFVYDPALHGATDPPGCLAEAEAA
jgi:uncharacterized Zn-finger protein